MAWLTEWIDRMNVQAGKQWATDREILRETECNERNVSRLWRNFSHVYRVN